MPSLAWSLPIAAALFLVIASPAALALEDGAHPVAPSTTAGVRQEACGLTSTALVPIEHAFETFRETVALDQAVVGWLMPAVPSATSKVELDVAVSAIGAEIVFEQWEGHDFVKIFVQRNGCLHTLQADPVRLGYTHEIPTEPSETRYVKGYFIDASKYDAVVAWLRSTVGASGRPDALRVAPSLGVVVVTDTAARLREWERGVREHEKVAGRGDCGTP